MAKLTKSLVEALEPSKDGVKGSYLFAWDQELRGFGVQVMPSGLKSFILQYRNGEKRSRRIVIGRYGVMTVEEARKEARVLLGKIAKGVDPADEKPPEGDTTTIAEICDWYVTEAEAGRILGKKRRPIKPSTLRMDRSRIEAHLKPLLGKRQVGRAEARRYRRCPGRHCRRQNLKASRREAAAAPRPAARAWRRARCRRFTRSSSTRSASARSTGIPPKVSGAWPVRRASGTSAGRK